MAGCVVEQPPGPAVHIAGDGSPVCLFILYAREKGVELLDSWQLVRPPPFDGTKQLFGTLRNADHDVDTFAKRGEFQVRHADTAAQTGCSVDHFIRLEIAQEHGTQTLAAGNRLIAIGRNADVFMQQPGICVPVVLLAALVLVYEDIKVAFKRLVVIKCLPGYDFPAN